MDNLLKKLENYSVRLNALAIVGAIVAVPWLAILGKWEALGLGIAALFFASTPLSLILYPTWSFIKIGKTAMLVFTSVYIDVAITAWCGVVLFYVQYATDLHSAIPLLFWSYFVALRPILSMSYRDDPAVMSSSQVTALFAQLGYFLMVALLLLVNVSPWSALTVFGIIMLIGTLTQWRIYKRLMWGWDMR